MRASWILAICGVLALLPKGVRAVPGVTGASGFTGASGVTASSAPSGAAIFPALAPLAAAEVKTLRRQFAQAQGTELRALEHRHRAELLQLKSAQAAQMQSLTQHASGTQAERSSRRKRLMAIQKDELARRQSEQSARIAAIREDQAMKRRAFSKSLARGVRPDLALWPEAGR